MYGENRIKENISRLGQTCMLYLAVAGCYVWLGICTLASVSKSAAKKYYEEHLKKCEFVHRGVRITTDRPIVRPVFETICNAPKFLNWLNAFPLDRFDLRSINLTDVDFFGSSSNPDKLGFLKFKCDVYTKLGPDRLGDLVRQQAADYGLRIGTVALDGADPVATGQDQGCAGHGDEADGFHLFPRETLAIEVPQGRTNAKMAAILRRGWVS
jgi:hypothetical protein